MYMGQVGSSAESRVSNEFLQSRILLTGLTALDGVDVARSFADLKARLVVHTTDLSPELIELVALLSQSAGEIRLHTQDISNADTAADFARTSAQAFGGLEAAINLASISRDEIRSIRRDGDLEALIAAKLEPLTQLTRIIANRMSVVLSEGLILNVLKMPHPETAREAAVAAFARTALAEMTVREATSWARQGIRINAVGPRVFGGSEGSTGACLTSEPHIATLAVHLASRKGRSLSGYVFDADGTACC
jgi:3-oxoacyl-[acyl-carrier protein] reductase